MGFFMKVIIVTVIYESLVMLIIDYGLELLSYWGPVIQCHSGGCTSVCEQELSLNILHVCSLQSTSCYGPQWAGHIRVTVEEEL